MMNLRVIAEEMENMDEMQADLLEDLQEMQIRHSVQTSQQCQEHDSECAEMELRHEEEIERLSEYQREEVEELDRMIMDNRQEKSDLQRRMQAWLQPAGATASVPQCPVCLDKMRPPVRIFNCRNGHLICGQCRPQVDNDMCTTCRVVEYTGRATAVEQMIRQMHGQQ